MNLRNLQFPEKQHVLLQPSRHSLDLPISIVSFFICVASRAAGVELAMSPSSSGISVKKFTEFLLTKQVLSYVSRITNFRMPLMITIVKDFVS